MGFWSLEMLRFQSGDWQSLKVNPSESLASVKVETCGTCPKKSINSWYLQSSQPGPTGPKICNSDLQLNYKYKRLARFSRFCLWSTTAWMLQQKDFFWNILDQLRSPPALGWPKERQVWKCSTILPSRPGESPCHWRCHWVIGVFCFFQPCVFFSEVGDGWFFGEVKKTEVYFMFCDFQFPFEWLEWWPWLYYNTIHPVSVFVNTIDTASILGYNRPIYQPPLPAQWSY